VKIVFVHPRGAGQFRFLAAHLAQQGARVTILSEENDRSVPNVRMLNTGRAGVAPAPNHRLRHLAVADKQIQYGHRVARALDRLSRAQGPPDIVVGHIGWGGLLFARDVLPEAPLLAYCEYYFRSRGGDLGFDPSAPATVAELNRARLRNMIQRANLDVADAGFSATQWQKSRYPAEVQSRIAVCHEGIDLSFCIPDESAVFTLPDGRVIRKGDPVITYVSRSLEPQRGFPQFMRAAATLAARRSDAIFLVAGSDQPSYSRPPASAATWREAMLAETGIDPRRIVFLAAIDHKTLVRIYQVSAAHIYLTVPFVLSWSMLEAMASGCLVIGSRTAPVEEVIADGKNGLLVDFFDTEGLASRIAHALDHADAVAALRRAARTTIERRYERRDCLARQLRILGKVIEHRRGRNSAALG
jgi:glycosyltransferase involved in cell wall biosynthesis